MICIANWLYHLGIMSVEPDHNSDWGKRVFAERVMLQPYRNATLQDYARVRAIKRVGERVFQNIQPILPRNAILRLMRRTSSTFILKINDDTNTCNWDRGYLENMADEQDSIDIDKYQRMFFNDDEAVRTSLLLLLSKADRQ